MKSKTPIPATPTTSADLAARYRSALLAGNVTTLLSLEEEYHRLQRQRACDLVQERQHAVSATASALAAEQAAHEQRLADLDQRTAELALTSRDRRQAQVTWHQERHLSGQQLAEAERAHKQAERQLEDALTLALDAAGLPAHQDSRSGRFTS